MTDDEALARAALARQHSAALRSAAQDLRRRAAEQRARTSALQDQALALRLYVQGVLPTPEPPIPTHPPA